MRLLALMLALGACSHGSSDRGAIGAERGDCRPDKTCDPNLLCLSNLCVRPPPADCQDVAETLASIELGNYAEPETRAPVIAKYKSDCDRLYVTKEEGKCLEPARDAWTAASCVPRMFPAYSGKQSCAEVLKKIETTVQKQNPTIASDPQAKAYFEATMHSVQDSCQQDAWPAELKQCLLEQDLYSGNPTESPCNPKIPPGLQQKLQERIAKAMQDAQPH
jgi:hypothetical protein